MVNLQMMILAQNKCQNQQNSRCCQNNANNTPVLPPYYGYPYSQSLPNQKIEN